ncbi:Type II/IV secretion system secretin RcpA/CpaC, associated with Flp pilus assembly, partial [hydrothermal vent metagenome]
ANGDALTLASPNLTARSGGEAEFLSGGEIPIVNEFANGSSVEYKEYGIKLKINPSADNNGNITARVETEISAIDAATTVDGIPGFLSRKTSADLSMRDGETIVISKLINSDLSKDTSGLKYLSSIPILGSLFRNKNLRDKKTELVIFVTPSVITADSKINKESLAAHDYLIKRFKDATDYKSWADEDSPNGDLLD